MNVSDLIGILYQHDPETEVYIPDTERGQLMKLTNTNLEILDHEFILVLGED